MLRNLNLTVWDLWDTILSSRGNSPPTYTRWRHTMDEREWFTQHPCPHCSHRASSNAELWVHRRTVHPAQEGLPVPEFRGRGNGEPSERDPRTYIYFGSNPPKSVLEYETKRMSLPSDIIRRKQDNFGVLDMSEAPPVVSVRSKYV